MSIDRPVNWPEYTYDPEDQLFKYVNTRGQTVSADLQTLTGGNYRIVGAGQIQHIGDVPGLTPGQLLGSVSRITPARLVPFTGGRAVLFNETPVAALGQARLRVGQYALSAEASITLPSGEVKSFPVRFAPLTREGMTAVVREVGGEIVQWGSLGNRPDPITGQVEQPLGEWRFATPSEQILRSIYGSLFSHFYDDLAALSKQGLVDEQGNPIETDSDAAAYLARIAYNNITGGWTAQL